MTIVIAGEPLAQPSITAFHFETAARKGYALTVDGHQIFISEAEADRLGRFLLFDTKPQTELDIPGDTDHG